VEFRINTLTDFVREIRENARAVNPSAVVIPEIYPGIEAEAPRVGADVFAMYGVVDAIAHEYEFGEGDHMASSRTQLDWLLYQAGMLSFRAFAEGKATWILNYSWDGDKNVDPKEDEDARRIAGIGWREFLGRAGSCHVWFERPDHENGNLQVDRGPRKDAVFATCAYAPRGSLFFAHLEKL
jgi:hypothetical protein